MQLKERALNLTLNKFLLASFFMHIFILTILSYSPVETAVSVSTPELSMLDINLNSIDDIEIEVKKNKEGEELVKSKIASVKSKATLYLPIYEVTTLPSFKIKINPQYPEKAKKAEIEGLVILEIDIDETGKVINVRVIKKAGFGFDEAAVESIKKSIFIPAYKNGKPVPVRVRLPIKFELE